MSEKIIINTHDQLRAFGGGVAITRSHSGGRDSYFNGWHVYRVNENGRAVETDKDAHWSDHGMKCFLVAVNEHDRGRSALLRAQKWVAEMGWYTGRWTRNRMYDYVPEEINRRWPIRR